MKSMRTVVVSLVLLCTAILLLAGLAQAQKKITWVTDQQTSFPGCDVGWKTLLETKGYIVTRDTLTKGSVGSPLTQVQIDALNTADLIIISRSTTSGNYNDTLGWNLHVTKPLIALSPQMVRGSGAGLNLKWFIGRQFQESGDGGCPVTQIVNKTHPIFTGVTVPNGDTVRMLDPTVGAGSTSLLKIDSGMTNTINGTVLATQKDTSISNRYFPAIVYFPAGTAFFTSNGGSNNTCGGKRMWFNAGTFNLNSTAPGVMNLTSAGQKIFFNAVQYMITGTVNGVATELVSVVKEFALNQNYPNPFNPSTDFTFQMAKAGFVSVKVFDILGREVATLVNEFKQAGSYPITWNATGYCSGVYFYKMQTETFVDMKKMILMK
jgi:hypothetical protein